MYTKVHVHMYTKVPGQSAHLSGRVERGQVQPVSWLLEVQRSVIGRNMCTSSRRCYHLEEEPCVQVQRVPLMLGAVVLGGDVSTGHQLPASSVEVPQDAGEEY